MKKSKDNPKKERKKYYENTEYINLNQSSTFIYSIQVELLNPGKLNKNLIKTINFNDNI